MNWETNDEITLYRASKFYSCFRIVRLIKVNKIGWSKRNTQQNVNKIPAQIFYDNRALAAPQRCLHLVVVVVERVRLCDPESNVGGSLTTRRVTHAGKVKG
jgi:hypothetical protein